MRDVRAHLNMTLVSPSNKSEYLVLWDSRSLVSWSQSNGMVRLWKKQKV